jgi:hypothetical protein
MTQPQLPTASTRKTLPSSKSTERHLVRNVTAENYQEVGSAFIGAYGGAIIALADGKSQGAEWTANPRQWGAWRAYLAARKIPIKFMDARGKEGKCWTVPAAWPHEFDGDATVQADQEAANWFMRNYRPERLDLAAAAKRAATVAAYRQSLGKPHEYRGEQSFQPFPKLWEAFADETRLLQGHRFEVYEEASKRLATQGRDSARKVLLAGSAGLRRETVPNAPAEPDLKYNNYAELLANYEKDAAAARGNKA